MATEPKSNETSVLRRNVVRLPASVCEECALEKGSKVKMYWGGNYQCVVIVPVNAKLGDNALSRIKTLTTKPLDTKD